MGETSVSRRRRSARERRTRLVLRRREGERILLRTPAGEVWVEATRLTGAAVVLTIEAPPAIEIMRGELAVGRRGAPDAGSEGTDSEGGHGQEA